MEKETFELILLLIVLIVIIILFVRVTLRIRKYGGSLTTTMISSMYDFSNKDKRNAIEQIIETRANKKMEEESTDKPIEDKKDPKRFE